MHSVLTNLILIMSKFYRGQAEKEFKVEVEAIGKVRHKNLVGLLGFCADGAKRYNELLEGHSCLLNSQEIQREPLSHFF